MLGLLRGELLPDLVGVERRVRPRRPRVAQVVLDAVEGRELGTGLDLRGGAAVTALPANPRATRPSMTLYFRRFVAPINARTSMGERTNCRKSAIDGDCQFLRDDVVFFRELAFVRH